jgi:hypothetical protein
MNGSKLNAYETSMRSTGEIIGKDGGWNLRSGFSDLRRNGEFEALTRKTAVCDPFPDAVAA